MSQADSFFFNFVGCLKNSDKKQVEEKDVKQISNYTLCE